MLGLLVAIPFGCDDDGTSPPDPDVDELPDTIPSGTYEVGDLELPAGESFTVAGDVVVLSSGSVVLDGAVIIGEAGSLTIVAEDSVILNGYI